MTAAARDSIRVYHQPIWGRTDPELKRSMLGAGLVGALVLLAITLAPEFVAETVTIEEMPERFARLILEPLQPEAPAPTAEPAPVVRHEAPPVVAQPEPEVAPPAPTVKPERKPEARRRQEQPKVAKDRGTEGRARAQQDVTESLAGATQSLDRALDGLAQALPTAQESATEPATNRRRGRSRREVRSGRSGSEVGAVNENATLASADLAGGTIVADGIAIAPISDVRSADVAAASSGAGAGVSGSTSAGGGEVRSNESLLAVVKRYAPAIQFCYENELKKQPGLRGKLVVSLTVLADGSVRDAVVVDDNLGSTAVTGCALAQIEGWQFPAVEAGVTTFRIPFLFTPPE